MRTWCSAAVLWLLVGVSPLRAATVTLAWNPSAEATGYRVQYGPMTGVWPIVVDVGNVTTAKVDLAPGTYFFIVRAYAPDISSGPSNEVSTTVQSPIDTSCDYPLGSKAIAIFVTALQKTGSGGAGSKARLDFQVASPGSPITRVAVRTNGADLATMAGSDLGALAGLWFTVPAAPATYALGVTASNTYGCSREQGTTFTVTVK